MNVKLLILTQYFPPEVGAPQNRLFELALRLQKLGVEVTVLTAMPNYPQMVVHAAYAGKKYLYEQVEGLPVHRTHIFVSRSKSIVARLRNYFSFVVSSARAARRLPAAFDVLLCESPPLFLGYSAMYLSRKKKARLVFNVSDLWPESAEKLGVVTNRWMLAMAYRLEARLYKRAALVTGQTQGICASIRQRFPAVPVYWLPNGVDLTYYNPSRVEAGDWRSTHGFGANDFIALYAGILGIAQGLEVILNAAQQLRNHPHLHWVLLGSGPEKQRLQQLCNSKGLTNLHFFDTVAKADMPRILRSVNAAVVPLRKLELFKGAIPSKLFEALAMELPLLLGVDGEARTLFIEQGGCGLYVEPENAEALAAAVQQLLADAGLAKQLGANGRRFVNAHFNREAIAQGFFSRLQEMLA